MTINYVIRADFHLSLLKFERFQLDLPIFASQLSWATFQLTTFHLTILF